MKVRGVTVNKRTISSIVLVVILALILIIDIPIIYTIFVVLLSVFGVYEYNKAFKSAGYHPLEWVGYLGCLCIFLMGNNIEPQVSITLAKVMLPLMLILMFINILLKNLRVNIIDLAISLLSVVYVPFMFSFIKLIFSMEHGRILIMFVFLGAFASDVMAYLIGSKFGKKKLCPVISPKKTVEGSVAGIIGVIISYIVIVLISNHFFGTDFNIIYMSLLAIIVSISGQFGDLAASAIKRYCKIKDFGNIMPGHGGILDRCDSIMFVAPIVYIFFKVYIGM
jgi:phosphatidate cytidylyltransferase